MGEQVPGIPPVCSVIPNICRPLSAAVRTISCKVLKACPLATVWVCTSRRIFITNKIKGFTKVHEIGGTCNFWISETVFSKKERKLYPPKRHKQIHEKTYLPLCRRGCPIFYLGTASFMFLFISNPAQIACSIFQTKARSPSWGVASSIWCSFSNSGSTLLSSTTVIMAEHMEGHACLP